MSTAKPTAAHVLLLKAIPPPPPPTFPKGVDELQTLELFQRFLVEGYRGSLGELQTQLGSKRGRETLLRTVREYYHAERLHVLRCLKHLLGYWQDSGHPYRVGGAGTIVLLLLLVSYYALFLLFSCYMLLLFIVDLLCVVVYCCLVVVKGGVCSMSGENQRGQGSLD